MRVLTIYPFDAAILRLHVSLLQQTHQSDEKAAFRDWIGLD